MKPLPGHGQSFDDSVRRTIPAYGHGQFSIISLKGKMSACVSRQKVNPTISQTFKARITVVGMNGRLGLKSESRAVNPNRGPHSYYGRLYDRARRSGRR